MIEACQYMNYKNHMALVNDKLFQMRTTAEFLRRVDDWRRAQEDLPSRTEAIRRLVELGLKVTVEQTNTG
jgi:hypothetical protein